MSLPRAAILLLSYHWWHAPGSTGNQGSSTTFIPTSQAREQRHRGCETCSGSHSRKQRGRLTPRAQSPAVGSAHLPPLSSAFHGLSSGLLAQLPALLSASTSETQFWHLPEASKLLQGSPPCFKGKSKCPKVSPPWPGPCPPHHHMASLTTPSHPSWCPRLFLAVPGSQWFSISALFSPVLPGSSFLPSTQACLVPSPGSAPDLLIWVRCHPSGPRPPHVPLSFRNICLPSSLFFRGRGLYLRSRSTGWHLSAIKQWFSDGWASRFLCHGFHCD